MNYQHKLTLTAISAFFALCAASVNAGEALCEFKTKAKGNIQSGQCEFQASTGGSFTLAAHSTGTKTILKVDVDPEGWAGTFYKKNRGHWDKIERVVRSDLDSACWVGIESYVCANAKSDIVPDVRVWPKPPFQTVSQSNCRMGTCNWASTSDPIKVEYARGTYINRLVAFAEEGYGREENYPAQPRLDIVWGTAHKDELFCSKQRPAVKTNDYWEVIDIQSVGEGFMYSFFRDYIRVCHGLDAHPSEELFSDLGYHPEWIEAGRTFATLGELAQ